MEAGESGTEERVERPEGFLADDDKDRVRAAVEDAERETSGEIRVLITAAAVDDALAAAKEAFQRLKMHETRERNGVLILLATAKRSFAILGDEGVHRFVGQDGWEHMRDGMAERFRKGDFGGGLVYAVEEVGKVLREHFPPRHDDVDELSNEVHQE